MFGNGDPRRAGLQINLEKAAALNYSAFTMKNLFGDMGSPGFGDVGLGGGIIGDMDNPGFGNMGSPGFTGDILIGGGFTGETPMGGGIFGDIHQPGFCGGTHTGG